jgi:hypothetical protein
VQLVFVHGVNTRRTADYDQEVKTRDRLFREVGFVGSPTPLEITNSFWGESASRLAWNQASLPSSAQGSVAFATQGVGGASAAMSRDTPASFGTFAAALDAIFVRVVEAAAAARRDLTDEEVALFASAASYLASNPAPPWYKTGMDDRALIAALDQRLKVDTLKSFGLGSLLQKVLGAPVDRLRNEFAVGLTSLFRDRLNKTAAMFLGDVFVYLHQAAARETIRKIVVNDLVAAFEKSQQAKTPLVVIGHSLGGVILYDLLSEPHASLREPFKIDALLTVGSQPGLFEELKLFESSDTLVPASKGDKAKGIKANVTSWMNVYDPTDLFGFRAEPIFEGCDDAIFSSVTGLVDAHTSYFKRPQFYQRLAKRLKEKGLLL